MERLTYKALYDVINITENKVIAKNLRIKQICDLLCVDKSTIHRAIKDGAIIFHKYRVKEGRELMTREELERKYELLNIEYQELKDKYHVLVVQNGKLVYEIEELKKKLERNVNN